MSTKYGFFGLATKHDLDAMEKRIIAAIVDAIASEKALAQLRDELKSANERLQKAVEQNKP